MSPIQTDIEKQLATAEPDVEVLLAEVLGGRLVRLYIDHPAGVSLELCERVSKHLESIRERFTLEVTSPGIERPLTKPEHFRRYVGRRARVCARRGIATEREDQKNSRSRQFFTGELLAATDQEITVAAESGVVSLAYSDIQRSNLLGD